MAIVENMRKKGLLTKQAGESESEEMSSSESELSSEGGLSSESEGSKPSGASRPCIEVYAQRVAGLIEKFVHNEMVTDKPAEHIAEIMAYMVKHFTDKGYSGMPAAPSIAADRIARTASTPPDMMDTIARYHKQIAKQKTAIVHLSNGHSDDALCGTSGRLAAVSGERFARGPEEKVTCLECRSEYLLRKASRMGRQR